MNLGIGEQSRSSPIVLEDIVQPHEKIAILALAIQKELYPRNTKKNKLDASIKFIFHLCCLTITFVVFVSIFKSFLFMDKDGKSLFNRDSKTCQSHASKLNADTDNKSEILESSQVVDYSSSKPEHARETLISRNTSGIQDLTNELTENEPQEADTEDHDETNKILNSVKTEGIPTDRENTNVEETLKSKEGVVSGENTEANQTGVNNDRTETGSPDVPKKSVEEGLEKQKNVTEKRKGGCSSRDGHDYFSGFLIYAVAYICIIFMVTPESKSCPGPPEIKKCNLQHHSLTNGWTTTTTIKIDLVTVPGPIGKNFKLIQHGGNSELEPRRCVDEGVLLCICDTCRSRRCQTMPNRATGRSPSQVITVDEYKEKTDHPPMYHELFMASAPPTYHQALEMESIV